MSKKYLAAALLAAAAAVTVLPATAQASPSIACAYDRPCIKDLYMTDAGLYVGWDGQDSYDHYNFRWSRPGRAESQHEIRGGSAGGTTIKNAWSGTTYTVKVQGCDTDFFGSSTCTTWEERWITTP
ncbi:fibronectin type III domain-containing protein [Nocardia huaxiensis]|uniref:Fibronectin type III domain-containing protein n=1 Tax=Nocardia huaxiensis TaxID=2755382 RepID=A0A7D6ZA05_9NOCA|nr:fibronectin type III domain-containing protein [Nocardia huaxiensis]QLY28658.1 fibronectin type III domain-containing protein [Nocardia huaxiensis]